MVIWRCCSGQGPTDVHGTELLIPVPMPPGMGIWRCCSGQERMDAHGTCSLVPMPLGMGIWRCCSGQERMGVHGTKTLVPMPPLMGIWRCCSGLQPMDAHRTKMLGHRESNKRIKKTIPRRHICYCTSLAKHTNYLVTPLVWGETSPMALLFRPPRARGMSGGQIDERKAKGPLSLLSNPRRAKYIHVSPSSNNNYDCLATRFFFVHP